MFKLSSQNIFMAILSIACVILIFPIYKKYTHIPPSMLQKTIVNLPQFPIEDFHKIHSNSLQFPTLFEDTQVSKSIKSIETYILQSSFLKDQQKEIATHESSLIQSFDNYHHCKDEIAHMLDRFQDFTEKTQSQSKNKQTIDGEIQKIDGNSNNYIQLIDSLIELEKERSNVIVAYNAIDQENKRKLEEEKINMKELANFQFKVDQNTVDNQTIDKDLSECQNVLQKSPKVIDYQSLIQNIKDEILKLEKALVQLNKDYEMIQLKINEQKLASQFSEILKEIGADVNLKQQNELSQKIYQKFLIKLKLIEYYKDDVTALKEKKSEIESLQQEYHQNAQLMLQFKKKVFIYRREKYDSIIRDSENTCEKIKSTIFISDDLQIAKNKLQNLRTELNIYEKEFSQLQNDIKIAQVQQQKLNEQRKKNDQENSVLNQKIETGHKKLNQIQQKMDKEMKQYSEKLTDLKHKTRSLSDQRMTLIEQKSLDQENIQTDKLALYDQVRKSHRLIKNCSLQETFFEKLIQKSKMNLQSFRSFLETYLNTLEEMKEI